MNTDTKHLLPLSKRTYEDIYLEFTTQWNDIGLMADNYGKTIEEMEVILFPNTDTNNKPLYKVLNEQRTQGNWKVAMSNNSIWANNEFAVCDIANWQPEYKSNAQYIALSVNNLAALAEALEGWVDYHNSEMSEAEEILLNKTKAALKPIS